MYVNSCVGNIRSVTRGVLMSAPKQRLVAATAAVAVASFMSQAQAAQTQVDISSQVDSNLQTWSDGGLYPLGGTTLSYQGINFTLADYPGGGTGIVEALGNDSHPISVDIPGAETVYVLVNSAWGSAGSTIGSLVFSGTGGAAYTDTLVEGTNVRDHYYNTFVNSATDIYNTFQWGTGTYQQTVRLDEYVIDLPSSFLGQTLTSITLNGINAGSPQGAPFLAAATVASGVPEPSTWVMMLAGFAALGLAGRPALRKGIA